MAVHQVAQGETIITIAKTHGFADWRAIYEHSENAQLRKDRPDPLVLKPGDQVTIPEKKPAEFEVTPNEVYGFQLKRLTAHFEVRLVDEAGAPYADCRYALSVGDADLEGVTDAEGGVCHEIAPDAKTATLRLWYLKDAPDEVMTWEFDLGHLDPIDTVEGVKARLNNLGFRAGAVDATMDDQATSALKDFQRSVGMDPPSGQVDEPTKKALLEAHGR